MNCEYCGSEDMDYVDCSAPYGSTYVDNGWYECANSACLGEKEPACYECGNYAWQVGEDEFEQIVIEGDLEPVCIECQIEFMNEGVAA
jgi:hypothetical protein